MHAAGRYCISMATDHLFPQRVSNYMSYLYYKFAEQTSKMIIHGCILEPHLLKSGIEIIKFHKKNGDLVYEHEPIINTSDLGLV